MPRHLVRDTRASVARALGHAGRLTRRYVSGEHLMTVLVSAVHPGRDPRPARAVLHSCGATIEDVAAEIARRAGPGAVLFGGLDQDALAAIGIDLDAVRARIGSIRAAGGFDERGSDRHLAAKLRIGSLELDHLDHLLVGDQPSSGYGTLLAGPAGSRPSAWPGRTPPLFYI